MAPSPNTTESLGAAARTMIEIFVRSPVEPRVDLRMTLAPTIRQEISVVESRKGPRDERYSQRSATVHRVCMDPHRHPASINGRLTPTSSLMGLKHHMAPLILTAVRFSISALSRLIHDLEQGITTNDNLDSEFRRSTTEIHGPFTYR